MPTSAYMQRRMQYLKGGGTRPQAILWSNNSGTLSNGAYIPNGNEGTDFIILSDHNRSEISLSQQRIESRQRMVNANMRSYHIADKLNMSVSWNMLPSRGYSGLANFDETTGISPNEGSTLEYTADGGAGGVELLDWYENHQGPFWMYLAYDKYSNFSNNKFGNLAKYNQIIQVYFADFNYTVVKRGGTNHDLWNISVNLEEV